MSGAFLSLVLPLLSAGPDDPLATGQLYATWFREGKVESLWERMSPEMRGVFKDLQGLKDFQKGVAAGFGAETAMRRETVVNLRALKEYIRVARHEKGRGPLVTQFSLDDKGTIRGLLIRPEMAGAAATKRLDYRTKTPLRFPADGDWFVFWGGRDVTENYHAADRGQRFAYDLLVVRDGTGHEGDGKRLEQYYAFDRPILAPAAGVVTAVEGGMPDLAPGTMDPRKPMGNHVIVDHGNGEFSFLCHLKQGSVTVKPGDRVAAGQTVARCGNSGNTSEPHLHYHLQTTGVFGRGDGLPAQFKGLIIDGKPADRGEPVRGQTVRAGESR